MAWQQAACKQNQRNLQASSAIHGTYRVQLLHNAVVHRDAILFASFLSFSDLLQHIAQDELSSPQACMLRLALVVLYARAYKHAVPLESVAARA